ncbi:MAG: hypothetical protein J3T61_03705 [Candidatus Brocadiales bacterium]|nr:hypothetical protein [Candidatus Bathyanammoxibius sp.]
MNIAIYLHSDKGTNREIGEKVGLVGEALEYFLYAGYEHEMLYEVDQRTGAAKLIGVDGRRFWE